MTKLRPILTLIACIAFVISPIWVPDFGGFDADQSPIPQIEAPVQPEGYAFAIWGVIYLWLLVSAVFGLLKRSVDTQWQAMRPALIVSLAIGAAWLPVATFSPIWATILIWTMLIPALIALFQSPKDDMFWASLPLGLYAGWLSAASFAGVGLVLAGYNITTQTTAAWVCVTLASALGFTVQWKLGRAPTYGIAVIWALIAIAVQNGFNPASVASAALVGSIALLWPTFKALR